MTIRGLLICSIKCLVQYASINGLVGFKPFNSKVISSSPGVAFLPFGVFFSGANPKANYQYGLPIHYMQDDIQNFGDCVPSVFHKAYVFLRN